MGSNTVLQLAILWFVVLIFLQTGSGGGGTVSMTIGTGAAFLVFIIPLTIVIYSVLEFTSVGPALSPRESN